MPAACASAAGTGERAGAGARHRLRVPALRAVPAHERVRERGLRPARAAARPAPWRARSPRACEAAGAGADPRAGAPLSGADLGRPAAARRAGPRAGHRAASCCCSTSPSARSTRRCAKACALAAHVAREPRHSPPFWSRTIRKRRWRSPIAWRCCGTAAWRSSTRPPCFSPSRRTASWPVFWGKPTVSTAVFVTGRRISSRCRCHPFPPPFPTDRHWLS